MAEKVLRKAVLAGGVVYPAGTPATAHLEDLIAPKHWSGGEETDAKFDRMAELHEQGHPVTENLREIVQHLLDAHLDDINVPAEDLVRGLFPAFGWDLPIPDDLTDAGPAGDPETAADPATTAGTPPVLVVPAGNASRDAWAEYATAVGATHDDLDGLGQREIRARYAPSDED